MLDDTEKTHSDLEKIDSIVAPFSNEAERRVGLRKSLESRWIADLRQFHGRYDAEIERRFQEGKSSRLFMNATRPKTNAMSARLIDLLFPTDDKNWSISPTPVPELAKGAEQAVNDAVAKEQQAAEMAAQAEGPANEVAAMEQEGQEIPPEMLEEANAAAQQADQAAEVANEAIAKRDELQGIIEEATRRCDMMAEEIEDQLKSSLYQAVSRRAIIDGCKVGTGVIKGPVIGGRVERRWVKDEAGQHVLEDHRDDTPATEYVSYWAFFPDPDASEVEESESFYQRHLPNGKMLRKMAREQDFDKKAVRKLLKGGPEESKQPEYISSLREITQEQGVSEGNRYIVWEYTGAIDNSKAEELAGHMGDSKFVKAIQNLDPLEEMNVKMWFCQGHLLKFTEHPLDSGEPVYSVFNYEKDDSSIFGFGIPTIMRDPQIAKNAAWRMMMDNGGLSTGPQIVVDKAQVEPEDGEWSLTPNKVWVRVPGAVASGSPFETYNIESHQGELANIIEIAGQDIDETTAMPQIAMGEQGAGVTKTAQGMSLLMNSANVVFKGVVKNWDDNITTPIIRRFYHWNMQFNDKDEIKGDYEVDAVGSSSLLVREMQASNLMSIALQFGDHPIYGTMTKHAEIFRQIVKAHNLSEDLVVKTEQEIKSEQEAASAQPAEEDPAMALHARELDLKEKQMEVDIEIANMETGTRVKIAELNHKETMAKLAETINMNDDKHEAALAKAQMDIESRERGLAVEVGMQRETGKSAGGAV